MSPTFSCGFPKPLIFLFEMSGSKKRRRKVCFASFHKNPQNEQSLHWDYQDRRKIDEDELCCPTEMSSRSLQRVLWFWRVIKKPLRTLYGRLLLPWFRFSPLIWLRDFPQTNQEEIGVQSLQNAVVSSGCLCCYHAVTKFVFMAIDSIVQGNCQLVMKSW